MMGARYNNHKNSYGSNKNQIEYINMNDVVETIKNANKEYIEYSEKIARDFNNSNHTLRTIYNYILSIKNIEEDKTKLLLLKAKVAYLAGRKLIKKNGNIQKLISKMVDEILQSDDNALLERFKSFFEAIVAYHRYYKGDN